MTNNCDLYIQNTRTRVLLVLFSALMLATLFGSCDRKPSATTPNPKIALRYVHDVVLDYPLDRLFEKRTELLSHFYDKNDNLFFANLNQRDSVLDIHDWEHNHTSRSLDISGVMREFELQEASIALIIAERFFLFGQVPIDYTDRFTDFKDQRVVEIDSSGQLIEAYSLYKLMGCDSLDDGCPFRFLLDFLPDHRPVYANNKAYIGKVVSNPGFDFMGQDGFKKLMTLEAISTQDFVLDFSNGGLHVLGHTGKSPSIYKEGFFDGSYGTSSRCVNSEGEVIYSSQSVDSVFVYSEKGLVSKHHFRASQHITSIDPVDWSDHNDYRAFTKQAIENPNYWGGLL